MLTRIALDDPGTAPHPRGERHTPSPRSPGGADGDGRAVHDRAHRPDPGREPARPRLGDQLDPHRRRPGRYQRPHLAEAAGRRRDGPGARRHHAAHPAARRRPAGRPGRHLCGVGPGAARCRPPRGWSSGAPCSSRPTATSRLPSTSLPTWCTAARDERVIRARTRNATWCHPSGALAAGRLGLRGRRLHPGVDAHRAAHRHPHPRWVGRAPARRPRGRWCCRSTAASSSSGLTRRGDGTSLHARWEDRRLRRRDGRRLRPTRHDPAGAPTRRLAEGDAVRVAVCLAHAGGGIGIPARYCPPQRCPSSCEGPGSLRARCATSVCPPCWTPTRSSPARSSRRPATGRRTRRTSTTATAPASSRARGDLLVRAAVEPDPSEAPMPSGTSGCTAPTTGRSTWSPRCAPATWCSCRTAGTVPPWRPPAADLYYLNVMAGPGTERAWLICDDPAHAWVRETWDDQPVDPTTSPARERNPPLMKIGLAGTGRIGAFHARTLAHWTRAWTDLVLVDVVTAAAGRPATPRRRSLGAQRRGAARLGPRRLRHHHRDRCPRRADQGGHLARHADVLREAGGVDLERTVALAELEAPSSVPVHIGFQRRFDAGYRRVREAVRRGELGLIHTVRAATKDQARPRRLHADLWRAVPRLQRARLRHPALRHRPGGGLVFAVGANKGDSFFTEAGDVDTAAAMLVLDDGILVCVTATRYNGAGHDVRMEVHGARAPCRSASTTPGPDLGGAGRELPARAAALVVHGAVPAGLRVELSAFVDVAAGGIPSPCTVADGLEAARIAEACADSTGAAGRSSLAEIPAWADPGCRASPDSACKPRHTFRHVEH